MKPAFETTRQRIKRVCVKPRGGDENASPTGLFPLSVVLLVLGVATVGLVVALSVIGLFHHYTDTLMKLSGEGQGVIAVKRVGTLHQQRDPEAASPSAHSTDQAGKPMLSWRVYLLPQLEQQNLFEQFKLDEPWDSPHNQKLIAKMPAIYRTDANLPRGKTTAVALVSKDSAMPHGRAIRFADITDGLSNTILFVHANRDCAVTWTKPDDIEFDPQNPLKCLGEGGTFQAVLCDGSVHQIPATIDAETMRRLVNRHDGKPVSLNF